MVRAKMYVDVITRHDENNVAVSLRAVTATDSEENKTFSLYTPSAQITMWITNPDAFNYFEMGKEYYLDFAKAN
jgi:hypothetical protein